MRKMFAFCVLLTGFTCAMVAHSAELTTRIASIAIHPERSASATALSNNHTTLSAQITAKVAAVPVGVSQRVAAGELLVVLDCTDYALALQMAEAQLDVAKARLALAERQKKRTDQLLSKQLTSQETADNAEVALIASRGEHELAQLGVRKADIDMARCQVHAPFDAIVTQRPASVGDLATAGTPLILLTDTAHIELSAQVKPDDIPQLNAVAQLHFEVNATRYPVELLRVGGVINTQTRQQEIRLRFSGEKPAPGAAGKLVWQDPRHFIPSDYVVTRDGQLGIFIARDGSAEFVPLPAAIPGRPAWARVSEQEQIIIEQLGQIQHGQALSSL